MLELRASLRGILLVASLIAGAWVLIRLWPVLLLVLIAVLMTMALMPAVQTLVRHRVPRAIAVVCIVLLILGAIAGLAAYLVPSLLAEVREVNDRLPEYAGRLDEILADAGLSLNLSERVQGVDWDKYASGQAGLVYGQQALTLLFALISIIVMTAYMLIEAPRIGRFFGQFLGAGQQEEAAKIFEAMCTAVGGYFRGQLITSTAIAIFTFALLQVFGVRNALVFAVLAAIADIVPLVGVFAAILPPVAAALQESSTTGLIVLVALLVYQQFEDRLLVPLVYGRTLSLSPLVVLVAVLFGAQLLGIVGVLIALPVAAISRVAVDYWLQHRRPDTSGADRTILASRSGHAGGPVDVPSTNAPAGWSKSLVLRGWRVSIEAVQRVDASADRSS